MSMELGGSLLSAGADIFVCVLVTHADDDVM